MEQIILFLRGCPESIVLLRVRQDIIRVSFIIRFRSICYRSRINVCRLHLQRLEQPVSQFMYLRIRFASRRRIRRPVFPALPIVTKCLINPRSVYIPIAVQFFLRTVLQSFPPGNGKILPEIIIVHARRVLFIQNLLSVCIIIVHTMRISQRFLYLVMFRIIKHRNHLGNRIIHYRNIGRRQTLIADADSLTRCAAILIRSVLINDRIRIHCPLKRLIVRVDIPMEGQS